MKTSTFQIPVLSTDFDSPKLLIKKFGDFGLPSVEKENSGLANGIMGAMQMTTGGLLGSLIIFIGGDESFFRAILCLLALSFLAIVCCISVCLKGSDRFK